MATYYVANAGNDGNAGTIASPWKTVAAVNAITFSAGDRILFNCGDTWKETLSPKSSGTAANRIMFGAYGNGSIPIIGGRGTVTGWNTAGNWTNQGSNRWSKAVTNAVSYRIRVWANGTELKRAETTAGVNVTTNFYYTPSVLWVYATSNPASAFSSMEMSGMYGAPFSISSKNYLTCNSINFSGGGWSSVGLTSCNNIKFDSCSIALGVPVSGIYSTGSTYCEVVNCLLDTGDRAMDAWQAENCEDGIHLHNGSTNWTIHDNIFRDWGHCAINIWAESSPVTNIDIHDNYFSDEYTDYGSAFTIAALPGMSNNIRFYRNKTYKLGTYNQLNVASGVLEFYDNIINGTKGNSYKSNNTGYGVAVAAYSPNVSGSGSYGLKVYNNTIVNCEDGGIFIGGFYAGAEIQANQIVNNICVNNGVNVHNSWPANIQLTVQAWDWGVLDNIYKNNLLYSSATTSVVRYRNATKTVAQFNALNGSDGDTMADNIGGDPAFVSASDFHLQLGSPAIGAGTTPLLSPTDYDVKNFATPPSIGAYESGSAPIVSPPVPIPVTSVTVYGAGNKTVITVDKGTLQMYANVLPVDADDTTVTWSVINGTGSATISASGLLTAITNGTVTVKATSNG